MPLAFFVHVGECDVADRSGRELLQPDVIVRHIISLVRLLLRDGVRFVVVSQLLVWTRQRGFSLSITIVNHLLEEALAELPRDRVMFWRHRGGFWRGDPFDDDAVHLNEHGLHRYWHNLRQALSICIRRSFALTPTPVLQPIRRRNRTHRRMH